MDDDLEPREAARIRRRDRSAEAQARALMRAGMGKVFKQIQDAQRGAAEEIEARAWPNPTGARTVVNHTDSRGPGGATDGVDPAQAANDPSAPIRR